MRVYVKAIVKYKMLQILGHKERNKEFMYFFFVNKREVSCFDSLYKKDGFDCLALPD